jgi:streptogramin lyase
MKSTISRVLKLSVPFALLAIEGTARATDLYLTSPANAQIGRYSAVTGALEQVLVAPGDGLRLPLAMAFGPDGNLYVSDGFKGVLRFDPLTGASRGVFAANETNNLTIAETLLFRPDGNLYVVYEGSEMGGVNRYDAKTGEFRGALIPPGGGGLVAPHDAAFGPDGNLYVTDYHFGGVRRFNGSTGVFIDTFIPPAGGATAAHLLFAPDGSLYVSEGAAGIIRHYAANTGVFLNTLLPPQNGSYDLQGMAFGPDGKLYVSDFAFVARGILRFDSATGQFVDVFITPTSPGYAESPVIVFGPCVTGATSLCVNDSRFRVTMDYSSLAGAGAAQPVQLTSDTGYFWFFSDSNVGAVVKVLDGCSVGGHFWVFAGGLTNLGVTMTVRDSVTGQFKTYTNPANAVFQPVADTSALPCRPSDLAALADPGKSEDHQGGSGSAPTVLSSSWADLMAPSPEPSSGATCAPSSSTLCLDGRFSVTATYDSGTQSGSAQAVLLTVDTGYLWFFDSSNVEVVVKVLNGCSTDSNYWVFAGGLTNVKTTIRVTDTLTGLSRVYRNAANTLFEPVQDTAAFATCP